MSRRLTGGPDLGHPDSVPPVPEFAGPVAVALILAVLGGAMIVLGKRGRADELDFAMGGHTRENTNPTQWAKMQRTVGTGLIRSGVGYLIAAAMPIVLMAAGVDGNSTIPPALLIVAISTAWLLRAVGRGITRLN